MNVKFSVNRLDFILRVLAPSAKLNDCIKLVLDTDGTIYSLTKMESGVHKSQITLFVETKVDMADGCTVESPIELNIGDSKKLISALSQLTDEKVDLIYDGTAILYESDVLSFRFALMVEEAMEKKTVAKSRIAAFKPKTSFMVEKEILKKLLSLTQCIPNCDKMYFSCGSKGVRCVHTDTEQGCSDKIDMILTDTFTGEPIGVEDSIIVSEEVFKYVIMNGFDACKIDIVDPGIVIITISSVNYKMKYIVPKRLK